MFSRRIATVATRSSMMTTRRTYFAAQGGEEGIWGATMVTLVGRLFKASTLAIPFLIIVWTRHNPGRQWIYSSTDLFEDDGTVMEGEEAIANLRIQRERIMPFMNQYQEKIDAAVGVEAAAAPETE